MSDAAVQRAYWDRHSKNYARSMRLLGKPLPRVLELTEAAVSGATDVLEVAAGTGLFTERIAPRVQRLVATDYSAGMVDLLAANVRQRGLVNVECRQADLYNLDYPAHSFDVVVAANVLHLIPDLPAGLACLRRVVRPGGKLIVPTFCHDETLISRVLSRALALTGFPGHRRFTSSTLSAALQNEGLRATRLETVPGVIPIAYTEAVVSAGSAPAT